MLGGRFLSILVVSMLVSSVAFSQERAQINKPGTGLWFGLYTKLQLSKKLFYYAETHYRRRNSLDNLTNFAGRMGQVYNRHGFTYLFNNYFEVTAGPVLVLNYTPQPGNQDFEKMTLEPRFWHQWLFIQPMMGRVKIYNQFRFEHRFKRTNALEAPYKYTNRYRYKIYAYIPVNKKYLGDRTLFFSPSAEIFMHSGKSIVYNPFEDFRVYTAIGYIINKNYMLFGGHMWTLGQGENGFSYGQSHVIRLNLYISFDLRNTVKSMPEIRMSD